MIKINFEEMGSLVFGSFNVFGKWVSCFGYEDEILRGSGAFNVEEPFYLPWELLLDKKGTGLMEVIQ